MSTRTTRRLLALAAVAVALALTAVPALAGNKIAAIGGCYTGTFTGWREGTVTVFIFSTPEGPSVDATNKIEFSGQGREGEAGELAAFWQGNPGNSNQPGGYLIVRNHLYGNGNYMSDTLNQPENMLVSGKATMDGEKISFVFTTQRREKVKFQLTRSTCPGTQ